MCVVVAPAVVAAMALASAAVSGYAAYQSGQQQKELGEYNAKVAENNAIAQQYAAEDAQRRGQIAEDAQRRETRARLGAQRAALGAAGDSLTDISTTNLMADTAQFGELDALTVRNNAARQAWGLENAANDSLAQAGASRFQGRSAAAAGALQGVGTLIGGAANSASLYNRLKVK